MSTKIHCHKLGIAQDGITALDTNNNPLPVGEYEVELVWQYKPSSSKVWNSLNGTHEDFNNFSDWAFAIKGIYGNACKTQQVYIASVAPQPKLTMEEFKKIIADEYLHAPSVMKKHTIEQAAESIKEVTHKKVLELIRYVLEDGDSCLPKYNDEELIKEFNDEYNIAMDTGMFVANAIYQREQVNHIKSTHIPIVTGQNYEQVKSAVSNFEKSIYEAHGKKYPNLVPISEVEKIIGEILDLPYTPHIGILISRLRNLIKPQ